VILQLFAINDDKLTNFAFNYSDQVDEWGKETGDYQLIQQDMDSRAEELRLKHNALIDTIQALTGSLQIGHTSASITAETVAEALEENRLTTNTKANSSDVYLKTETYNKTEIDDKDTILQNQITDNANNILLKANDNEVVKLSGNQSISGTKTFTSSPNIPTPNSPDGGANKSYVDEEIAKVVIAELPEGLANRIDAWIRPVTDLEIRQQELYVNAGITSIVGPDGDTYYDYPDSPQTFTSGTIDLTKGYAETVTTSATSIDVTNMLEGVITDFEIGMEITLQDNLSKEFLTIDSISDPTINFKTAIQGTYAAGANVYRSNLNKNASVWEFGYLEIEDNSLKSLLHFDGSNGSTTFVDEIGKIWTANANAQLDTLFKKFGLSSSLFDGTSWVDTPDSEDFNLSNNDFTIDFWVKKNLDNVAQFIAGQQVDPVDLNEASFKFALGSSNTVSCFLYSNGSNYNLTSTNTITNDGLFHHIAVVRNGNVGTLYIDGVESDTIDLTGVTLNNSTAKMTIGRGGEIQSNNFNGHIDEFRFVNGKAKWTSDFTPPINPYPQPLEPLTEVDVRINIEARKNKANISAFLETNDFDTLTLDGALSIHAAGADESYTNTTDVKIDEGANNMYMSTLNGLSPEKIATMRYQLTRASTSDAIEIKRVQGGLL